MTGMAGPLFAFAGGKGTNFIPAKKAKALWCCLSADSSTFIAVFWTSSIIVRDFYTLLLADTKKRELGFSLYTHWETGVLLVLGEGLLWANCPHKDTKRMRPS